MIAWIIAVTAVTWAAFATLYAWERRTELREAHQAHEHERLDWDAERRALTAAAISPSNPGGAVYVRPRREPDPDAAPRVTPIGL